VGTLAEFLEGLAAEHGPRVALVEGGRALTFDELRAAAGALAEELSGWGVGRGDVVALWLPNVLEYLVAEFALGALGAAALGVNSRYGEHEVAHLLERARPVGVVVPHGFLDIDFVGKLPRSSSWVGVVGAPEGAELGGFDVGGGVHRLPDPTAEGGRREAVGAAAGGAAAGATTCGTAGAAAWPGAGEPEDPVAFFTTSGSTGEPKLAGHPQAAVVEHAVNVARAFDMRPGDAVHLALPLCGVFGFNAAFGMLAAGGTCVLEPVFDAERMARDIGERHVTHLVGGDEMLGRLMALDPPAWPDCRRGAIADFAGRADEVARWADERGIALSGVYGSSELFALISTWPAELPLAQRVPAGGVPVSSGIEVRAVDPETGVVCPPGETGELQFRGYPVTSGYLGGPAVPVDDDGWFSSGDLGSTTADGFLYRCRAGDALRLHGFLVEPAEIESFLLEQDGVDGAKVVGAGGVAVAFVTLRSGAALSGEDLRERCHRSLAAFKVPARVEVLDAFPVTTGTNGTKIRAAELRERAEHLLAR
jgi:acyl-CoA synthetase (AMP-forming)/AMP-acid ligase II